MKKKRIKKAQSGTEFMSDSTNVLTDIYNQMMKNDILRNKMNQIDSLNTEWGIGQPIITEDPTKRNNLDYLKELGNIMLQGNEHPFGGVIMRKDGGDVAKGKLLKRGKGGARKIL